MTMTKEFAGADLHLRVCVCVREEYKKEERTIHREQTARRGRCCAGTVAHKKTRVCGLEDNDLPGACFLELHHTNHINIIIILGQITAGTHGSRRRPCLGPVEGRRPT